MGERYPVTVAIAGSTPLFDPDNARVQTLGMRHPRLREARAADRRQDRRSPTTGARSTRAPRLHGQPARGVRRRGGGAAVEQHGGVGDRADARPARGRGAAARHDGDRRRPRDSPRHRRRASGTRRRPPRRSSTPIRSRARAARPDPVRQRVGRRRQLPGRRSASPTRSGCRASRRQGDRDRRTARVRCEQEVAGGRDVYEVPMPAVVTRQGGHQPAALPVGAGPAAREAQAARDAHPGAAPEPRLEMVRLALPAGLGQAGAGARHRRRGGARRGRAC